MDISVTIMDITVIMVESAATTDFIFPPFERGRLSPQLSSDYNYTTKKSVVKLVKIECFFSIFVHFVQIKYFNACVSLFFQASTLFFYLIFG